MLSGCYRRGSQRKEEIRLLADKMRGQRQQEKDIPGEETNCAKGLRHKRAVIAGKGTETEMRLMWSRESINTYRLCNSTSTFRFDSLGRGVGAYLYTCQYTFNEWLYL